ncbi:MAG TPA: hypothetical protein VGE10_10160 [Zeimonas sp.]
MSRSVAGPKAVPARGRRLVPSGIQRRPTENCIDQRRGHHLVAQDRVPHSSKPFLEAGTIEALVSQIHQLKERHRPCG